MKRLLLDNDTCVFILKGKIEGLADKLGPYRPGRISVSAITVAELEYGINKSAHREKNAQAVVEFLASLEIVPFGPGEAHVYGVIRAQLERTGKTIGSLDLLIAAQALAGGFILVTNNTREFSRVEGLKLENWL